MTEAEIFTSLARLLADQPGVLVPVDDIRPGTPLFEGGLDLDSFSVVNLIAQLEEIYGIEFQDDDFQPENFVDLATLSAVVCRYLPQGPAAAHG